MSHSITDVGECSICGHHLSGHRAGSFDHKTEPDRMIEAITCTVEGCFCWSEIKPAHYVPNAGRPVRKFILTIDELGNDAFVDNEIDGIADCLRSIADRMEDANTVAGPVIDVNGNTVGRFEIAEFPEGEAP